MVFDALSFAAVIGGVGVIGLMLMRSEQVPPLARYAIVGSALGLFMTSRYIEVDHSFGGIVFAVGVAVVLMIVAVRHLQAFRTAR